MQLIRDWLSRQFGNPQIVSLLLLLLAFWLAMTFFSSVFQPLFAALVLAYLLEGPVAALQRRGLGRTLAAAIVWTLFYVGTLLVLVTLLPQLAKQVTQIVQEIPRITADLQRWLLALPGRYPTVFSETQMQSLAGELNINLAALRHEVLARSHLLGLGVTYIVIYLILVPLIMFFLLKDRVLLAGWGRRLLPADIGLIRSVWSDVDRQLANYVRGKVVEILIVGLVTYLVFTLLDLRYAMLLAAITGLSVLIPFVGAALVAFPVAAVAYTQFGIGSEFAWVLIAYGVIQALDGNVLVPIIFSEANNLHPIAIIIAVLFFGSVYGFWGVFFAIPLATVIAAVLHAWPTPAASRPDQDVSAPEAS
jgi:putative permease